MSDSAWHDPTHGRIDRDIQEFVSREFQPRNIGQRVALENTLQEKRNRGEQLALGASGTEGNEVVGYASLVGRTVMVGTRAAEILAVLPSEIEYETTRFAVRDLRTGNQGARDRDEFYVLPTQEEIAEALGRHRIKVGPSITCTCGRWTERPVGSILWQPDEFAHHQADAVLTLLTGSET